MKCPLCMAAVKQKTVLYPSGSINSTTPLIDCVSDGLRNLNKVLFKLHSDVELNHAMEKIIAANQSHRQNDAFISIFSELTGNIIRLRAESDAIFYNLQEAREENKIKEIELEAWQKEANILKAKISKLKKQKKMFYKLNA